MSEEKDPREMIEAAADSNGTTAKIEAEVSQQVEAAKEEMAAQVSVQVAEQVAAVQTEVGGQVIERVAEAQAQVTEQVEKKVKEVVADKVEKEVAAKVEAAATQLTEAAGANLQTQQVRHLFRLTAIQSYALIFITLCSLGLAVFFGYSLNEEKALRLQEARIAVAPEMVSSTETPLVISETYQQILKKQTDALENQPGGTKKTKEAIGNILLNSDKVSKIIQDNIESLRKNGWSNSVAVPQAFSAENVIAAIEEELPIEIKNATNIKEIIRAELDKISTYARTELSTKK